LRVKNERINAELAEVSRDNGDVGFGLRFGPILFLSKTRNGNLKAEEFSRSGYQD
jgi:hypothetical protein